MPRSESQSFQTRLSSSECWEKLTGIMTPAWKAHTGGRKNGILGSVRDNTAILWIGAGLRKPFQPAIRINVISDIYMTNIFYEFSKGEAGDGIVNPINSGLNIRVGLFAMVISIALLPFWILRGYEQRRRLTRLLKTVLKAEDPKTV